MFAVGELVVYGGEGVCRVVSIGPSALRCAERERDYYTLAPLYRTGQVMTPVDTRVLMRPVMTAQEAAAFIAALPSVAAADVAALSPRAVREHYQEVVTSYDCHRLAALLKLLTVRRIAAVQSGKKVSQLDERYSKRAEDILYGELAAALSMERSAMCEYIRSICPDWMK